MIRVPVVMGFAPVCDGAGAVAGSPASTHGASPPGRLRPSASLLSLQLAAARDALPPPRHRDHGTCDDFDSDDSTYTDDYDDAAGAEGSYGAYSGSGAAQRTAGAAMRAPRGGASYGSSAASSGLPASAPIAIPLRGAAQRSWAAARAYYAQQHAVGHGVGGGPAHVGRDAKHRDGGVVQVR